MNNHRHRSEEVPVSSWKRRKRPLSSKSKSKSKSTSSSFLDTHAHASTEAPNSVEWRPERRQFERRSSFIRSWPWLPFVTVPLLVLVFYISSLWILLPYEKKQETTSGTGCTVQSVVQSVVQSSVPDSCENAGTSDRSQLAACSRSLPPRHRHDSLLRSLLLGASPLQWIQRNEDEWQNAKTRNKKPSTVSTSSSSSSNRGAVDSSLNNRREELQKQRSHDDTHTVVYSGFEQAYPSTVSSSPISSDLLATLSEWSHRVGVSASSSTPDWHSRVQAVGWGGSRTAALAWWSPSSGTIHGNSHQSSRNVQDRRDAKQQQQQTAADSTTIIQGGLDAIDGGRLLWHYYQVMQRYMKGGPGHLEDSIHYPFKLCKQQPKTNVGCAAEQAIYHTLEFREKYQPWRISPAMMEENENGWVYHRGFSPPAALSRINSRSSSSRATTTTTKSYSGKNPQARQHHGAHSLLWIRPGHHRAQNSVAYFRCILNALERAVAEAYQASKGRVGKYNVMIDASGFEWSKLPAFAHIKQTITILQDHYPHRMGMICVANMSRSAEFFISMILPIVTKDVRDKIYFLSNNPERRAAELRAFVQPEYLPIGMGGTDSHEIDRDYYYSQSHFYWTDKESTEFTTTMPYHDISN